MNVINWTVATFAWDHMASETSLYNMLQDMGERAARFTVISTRIAYLMAKPGQGKTDKEFHKLVESAAIILQSKGATAAEVKEGQRRRTETEERIYNTARRWYSRLMQSQQIATSEKRGGARATKANEAKADKPKAEPVTPTAKEPKDGRIFIRQQAAMMLAYANKNAAHLDLMTRNAIEHFCKEVNSIKD